LIVMRTQLDDGKMNIARNIARLKMTGDCNCQIRAELTRNLAIMKALKYFIRRRIEARKNREHAMTTATVQRGKASRPSANDVSSPS